MSRSFIGFALGVAISCLASAAAAENASAPRIITVKIQVADFDKTLDFYKRVLLMQETLRNPKPANRPDGGEVGLNFGQTVEEAKANTAPTVVLVQSERLRLHPPKKSAHDVSPVVLMVPDIDAVAKRVADFGAPVMQPKTPLPPPYGGFVFMAYDPSGNVLEFIELKK